MDVSDFNKEKYEQLWKDLNRELDVIRDTQGLTVALQALEKQQLDQGFIQDDLKAVERYRICDPSDHSQAFTIQFNPRRALRQAGAGRTIPPPNAAPVNGNCFLCRDNVRWQQRGIEVGYDLHLDHGAHSYIAWMNPFPLMPTHTTIAAAEHNPQSWIAGDRDASANRIRMILQDFLELTRELPGFVGFYNGEGAGATIPGHFHFQFFKRPEGQQFPLERAAAIALAEHKGRLPLVIRKYPIKAMYFFGENEMIVDQAAGWIQRWTQFYESDMALSANMIGVIDTADVNKFHLYFIPRNRFYSHAPGMAGLVGGLEVFGELVFSTEAEKQQLISGQVGFDSVVRVLMSVEAPGVLEFLDTLPYERLHAAV